MTAMSVALLSTPCVRICVVDPVSALCIGCGRTVAEVTIWSEITAAEQRRVIAELPKRLVAARARTMRSGRLRERPRDRRSAPWL